MATRNVHCLEFIGKSSLCSSVRQIQKFSEKRSWLAGSKHVPWENVTVNATLNKKPFNSFIYSRNLPNIYGSETNYLVSEETAGCKGPRLSGGRREERRGWSEGRSPGG